MRVVHVLHGLSPGQGGVLTAALDLCAALGQLGANVEILLTSDASQDVAAENGTYPVRRFPLDRWGRLRDASPAQQHAYQQYLAAADVVHLHTPWSGRNMAIASRLRKLGKPYGVSIHGMLDRWSLRQKAVKKKLFLHCFAARFLHRAAFIHCTAAAETKQVLEVLPRLASTVVTLPCVFDAGPYLPIGKTERPAGEPRILFLSRLHPKKGCETLIAAAHILQQRGHKFRLVIAGPGTPSYVASLKTRVEQAGLQGITEFTGMVLGDEKLQLYRQADIFALPTQQENFGIVLVEAMAAALPVVTTKGTDIWSELEQGGARIVDATAASFADSLEGLILDSSERLRAGRQGAAHVARWLDTHRTAEGYLDVYRRSVAQA
ncbi:MAG: glycosyltransferase [Planctomycetales bacterium]|nr:glycosyltransferase [Planctomycetales bacterium]